MPPADATPKGSAHPRAAWPILSWAGTATVALLALAGNLLGLRGLTTFGAPFPPMEPLGALLSLVLAAGLLEYDAVSKRRATA